jgi:hypothetical protein
MNDPIRSLLRHLLTWFAGLGAFLFSHGLIGEGDVQAVNQDGATLGAAVVAILTVVITRVLMALLGNRFPALSKFLGGQGTVQSLLLVCTVTALILAGGALSSCSFLDDYELKGSAYVGGRDAKAGLKFEDGNALPFGRFSMRDRGTGQVTGSAVIEARKRVHADK